MHMKDRLKQIRIDNKMSQEQFGKEVDLTKGTVSKFES
ncbi:helix-turn-helix transcriptional regulator, partial [Bacillus thuringiensis]